VQSNESQEQPSSSYSTGSDALSWKFDKASRTIRGEISMEFEKPDFHRRLSDNIVINFAKPNIEDTDIQFMVTEAEREESWKKIADKQVYQVYQSVNRYSIVRSKAIAYLTHIGTMLLPKGC
jgi:hypothetical protein